MPSRHTDPESSPSKSPWNGDVQQLKCIGSGVSSLVFAIDTLRVVKIPLGSSQSKRDIEIERDIYQKFGKIKKKSDNHNGKYVLRCLEARNPEGLVFERCVESVRSRLRRMDDVKLQEKMRWMKQASKGLAFVHSCRVVQGDVGCHNMLLNSKGNMRLADFAGSSIDGKDATINYESRSRLPGHEQPTIRSDLFALGSAFYEMATGSRPYAKVSSHRDVQTLYRQKKFPDVSGIQDIGPIILKCWKQEYESASEIAHALNQVKSEAKIDEVEVDISLDGLVFTESTDSLDTTPSRSSVEFDRSDPYVRKRQQRRRSHKRDDEVQRVYGKMEKKKTHLHLVEHTSLSRFIFPWIRRHERSASGRE